jgi:hypothetical protein
MPGCPAVAPGGPGSSGPGVAFPRRSCGPGCSAGRQSLQAGDAAAISPAQGQRSTRRSPRRRPLRAARPTTAKMRRQCHGVEVEIDSIRSALAPPAPSARPMTSCRAANRAKTETPAIRDALCAIHEHILKAELEDLRQGIFARKSVDPFLAAPPPDRTAGNASRCCAVPSYWYRSARWWPDDPRSHPGHYSRPEREKARKQDRAGRGLPRLYRCRCSVR